jgi:DNA repair and recombination RAD54-like protein
MSSVRADRFPSAKYVNLRLVKWLGKDAVTPLAVDGKGGKAELLQKIQRWISARGRNVTQPGAVL